MSKENENRIEEDDKKEDLEDSEVEETEEQGDEDSAEKQLQAKDKKIKELEALIVKKKKKDKEDNQGDKPKPVEGDYLTKEEAVLLKEMDIEDLEKLKAVQKGEGHTSLKEAQESDLFQSYIERKKEEKKKKDAQLGSSKGSGGGESKFRQGMTDEEHKKAWKER